MKRLKTIARAALTTLGFVWGVSLLIAVVGAWLGLFTPVTTRVPAWRGSLIVLLFGSPMFYKVVRAAWRRQFTVCTLLTLGALAALGVGEWAIGGVLLFFMRGGELIEKIASERARRRSGQMTAFAQPTARKESV